MVNQKVPAHIAIIMDGNRRWAHEHHLPPLAGHRKVANKILEPLVEHAAKRGITHVTFWAFSTENWQRSPMEVKGIMQILRKSIPPFGKRMLERGVKLRVIGDLSKFDKDIRDSIDDVVEKTKDNTRITVALALNYGGRDEILRTANRAISYQLSAIRKKSSDTSEDCRLTTESFSQSLDTAGIPDPDMIVRTGGEQRTSGFLAWQGVYSELYFPSWYMPEFTPEKLDEVIEEFAKRKRRFGR